MELYKKKYYEALKNIQDVALSAIPLYNQIPSNHDYEMDVLIQITSGKLPNTYIGNNIELCIVLDRSGSMVNTIDSCKNAIKHIINMLNVNDKIHLIAYDDKVEKVFINCDIKDKTQMLNKLHLLKENGSTNLHDGIKAGLHVLLGIENDSNINYVNNKYIINTCDSNSISSSNYVDKFFNYIGLSNKSEKSEQLNKLDKLEDFEKSNECQNMVNEKINNNDLIKRTKIMFLFSDGMANAGITNSDKIGKMIDDVRGEEEIYISTFGIGTEYDEILMSSIAYCGKGNYFYIEKPETIPTIIENGLSGLTRHWSTNAQLSVTPEKSTLISLDEMDIMTEFKIREYALHRYLIKAKCNAEEAKITCTLNFTDYEGKKRTKEVICSWNYNGTIETKLIPNKEVICYKVIKECSEINKQIMNLMDDQNKSGTTNTKIEQLKLKIIELYSGVLADDEYGIIEALLKKEKDVLKAMKQEGITSHNATKRQGCTSISTGYTQKMCNYVSNSKNSNQKCVNGTLRTDADIGNTAFI